MDGKHKGKKKHHKGPLGLDAAKKTGSHKSKKRKHHKHMHGLGGFGDFGATYPGVARTVKEGGNVLGVLGGLWAGNFTRKQLEKIVNVTPSTDGKFQWQTLIAPLGTVAIGVGVTTIGHKMEIADPHNDVVGVFVKHVGYGVIGAGGVSLIKVTLKKDLLEGLSGTEISGPTDEEQKYLKESEDILKKLVERNTNFQPQLEEKRPDMHGAPYDNVSGDSDMIK
jgi:hypothetical protein